MKDRDGALWDKRRCLVTGGTGFGGSHLCEQLIKRGAVTYVLDRFKPANSYLVLSGLADYVEYIPGDVRDLELLKFLLHRYEIEAVFHLAAQPVVPMSIAFPFETLATNVLGTYAVLEAVRTSCIHPSLVFASSGAYYGTTRQQALIPEDQPPDQAANLYGPSKIAGDFAVRSYAQTFGTRAAVCRFMNTYGPGSTNFSTIIPAAIYKLMEGRPYNFGGRDDGTTTFEFMHVRDMANAYLAVAENIDRVRGQAFNFSGGSPIRIRELVGLVSRLFDGRERQAVFEGPPQAVPVRKCLNCQKAREVLGWQPTTPLAEGLDETIRWYRRYWPRLFKRPEAGSGLLRQAAADKGRPDGTAAGIYLAGTG